MPLNVSYPGYADDPYFYDNLDLINALGDGAERKPRKKRKTDMQKAIENFKKGETMGNYAGKRRYEPITVDIRGVMDMLGIGKNVAMDIGKKSGAVIHLSSRRTLYSVDKIKAYMESLTEGGKE